MIETPSYKADIEKMRRFISEDMDMESFGFLLIGIATRQMNELIKMAGLNTEVIDNAYYCLPYISQILKDDIRKLAEGKVSDKIRNKIEGWLEHLSDPNPGWYDESSFIDEKINGYPTIEEDEWLEFHGDSYETRVRRRLFEIQRGIVKLFIDEFQDCLTPMRLQLYNLYGPLFCSQHEYWSFCQEGGLNMVYNKLDNEEEAEEAAYFECEIQQIDLYRALSSGSTFTLRSDIYKGDKVKIGNLLVEELVRRFRDKMIFLWRSNQVKCGRSTSTFPKSDEFDIDAHLDDLRSYLVRKCHRARLTGSVEGFYYGAYNIIRWPKEYSWTDKCVFLYRLAGVCEYEKIPARLDFTNGRKRKEITGHIKRIILKLSEEDKNGTILRDVLTKQ